MNTIHNHISPNNLNHSCYDLALACLSHLRAEIMEFQKHRALVFKLKIMSISTGVPLLIANIDKMAAEMLIIPALAAFFFDYLINSYSFSIQRVGLYCQENLEPILKAHVGWPSNVPLWHEYVREFRGRKKDFIAMLGNAGTTALPLFVAFWVLFASFKPIRSGLGLLALMVFGVIDLYSYK